MTDYGRGSGSEPWHPEDPLFGDQGYQQQPNQAQQQDDWDPYATGQQPQYPYNGQQAPQQHPQQQQHPQHQHQHPQQEQYPQQHPQQGQYPQQGYPQQPQQPQPQQPQQQYNGWDTAGGASAPYGTNPGDPYGGQPPADPYGAQQPDFYGQGGYPPPQQPQYRQPPEQPQQPMRSAPDSTGDWDAEAEPESHAFFADDPDDAEPDDDAPTGRGGRKRGGGKKEGKKRRSGFACLVVLLVLGGGVGGIGYFGYQFYESHFGAAPDFTGQGTGDVQVEIPKGSTLTDMGNILKTAGVVKSVDAFTTAAGKDPKGKSIQAGVYLLYKEMSAAAAVTMMTDPTKQSAIIIPEGTRDAKIYTIIDKKLGIAEGTTAGVAKAQATKLGLPAWANTNEKIKDPLEGFLFPTRYSVGKGMKPEDVLRQMVAEATRRYSDYDLVAEAKKLRLKSPLEVITVASLVQAEGKTTDDFRKMSRVVYNRLVPTNKETFGILQFDSTYNYIKNTNNTNLKLADLKKLDDAYNTYYYKGLPPGPIGNPGIDALKAATDPDPGEWYYFISLDGKTTQFTKTRAEHDKLAKQYKG
ncbi:endolytic transglycosylase MltG [Streptomyces sp. H10-C2]|uniref:endolytic transglycosylase MltG n=1 Tax=unclassified Streptomyces TaxID=2593676 RepID=UPI0024BB8D0B|nr:MULTISPECIES: endolytic transglycosylase MltG [unclassified Streptomyces]MDJ0345267.1 endolytic transglycosylase MltG [Streptomyces sp. PH10-H1]MDJ0370718.1 endolytic transglycosylase MltG [Streptomyces sp. H10-C2]